MKQGRPILVTGSHRSGSTWVGKMLNLSPDVGYIWEPFHPNHNLGVFKEEFDWFYYIKSHTEKAHSVERSIRHMLMFKYQLMAAFTSVNDVRNGLRLIKDLVNFQRYYFTQTRPLIKDPIAFMSVEFLVQTFDFIPIILIRHPAAFASSLIAKKWYFDFTKFTSQVDLMNDLLYPFERDMEIILRKENPTLLEQSVLLWNIFHYVISVYRLNHPDWIFKRHEDLSRNPSTEFESLYQSLNLDYSNKISAKIDRLNSNLDQSRCSEQVLAWLNPDRVNTHRDSKTNIFNWKNLLSESEIDFIRTNTESIANNYYSESDW